MGGALSDATNQVAGQATLNPLICDPTTLFMAMALANVDREYLEGIAQKIEGYSLEYREFYSRAYEQLEGKLEICLDKSNLYLFKAASEKA